MEYLSFWKGHKDTCRNIVWYSFFPAIENQFKFYLFAFLLSPFLPVLYARYIYGLLSFITHLDKLRLLTLMHCTLIDGLVARVIQIYTS